jgi:transposase
MIVIGVDVHKHSLTAAAVDETGRLLAERTLAGGEDGLIGWAAALDQKRLWAVEDCRHVTGALERQLVDAGERLVRVPPKLTAPERRAGRTRGKSDAIDALAAARAALREPNLDRPRPGEERLRELKLLVVHRDDLVDERRRCQQRLRWHLHQLDPTLAIPAGALDRQVQLDRVGRWLARREQSVQGADRLRPRRKMPLARPRDQRAGARARNPGSADRARAARASRLRRAHHCQAALRDRADRPLPKRRTTRPPRRRRTARSELRPHTTTPTRPRRQPATQLRTAPHRGHASTHVPTRARLPRTQTSRREKPPRSDPLPQTPTRPRRLQHTESEPRLDIGATLLHRSVG